jgi:hypothetical protein
VLMTIFDAVVCLEPGVLVLCSGFGATGVGVVRLDLICVGSAMVVKDFCWLDLLWW